MGAISSDGLFDVTLTVRVAARSEDAACPTCALARTFGASPDDARFDVTCLSCSCGVTTIARQARTIRRLFTAYVGWRQRATSDWEWRKYRLNSVKAATYDRIARVLRVGACESNRDRIVQLITDAAEVRDNAMRACDEAIGLAANSAAKERARIVAALRTGLPTGGPDTAHDENTPRGYGCVCIGCVHRDVLIRAADAIERGEL